MQPILKRSPYPERSRKMDIPTADHGPPDKIYSCRRILATILIYFLYIFAVRFSTCPLKTHCSHFHSDMFHKNLEFWLWKGFWKCFCQYFCFQNMFNYNGTVSYVVRNKLMFSIFIFGLFTFILIFCIQEIAHFFFSNSHFEWTSWSVKKLRKRFLQQ